MATKYQLNKTIGLIEKYCHDKGQNLTNKRKAVLRTLLMTEKALSAYEIADICKNHFNEELSAMSVYRMLGFLQEQGLAHRLDLANKYVACSHVICGHKNESIQFLICEQCQRVEEINIGASELKSLQTLIKQTGFHVKSPQMEFNGICNQCFLNRSHSE